MNLLASWPTAALLAQAAAPAPVEGGAGAAVAAGVAGMIVLIFFGLVALALVRRRTLRCPFCHQVSIRTSRFRGAEALLLFFLMRPYRCPSCDRRFWRLWRRPAQLTPRPAERPHDPTAALRRGDTRPAP